MFEIRKSIRLVALATVALTASTTFAEKTNQSPDAVTSVALENRGTKGSTLFQRLDAREMGIDFENKVDLEHRWAHLYTSAFACSGVSVGDYDKDGRPDLFFSSQTDRSRLYRQVGDFEFQDVTEAAGIDPDSKWSAGSSFADVDGDGDLDLYVCTYEGRNELYLNQNDGTFVESARQAGLDYLGASHTVAFADYDNDGDLDLYLLNNAYSPLPGQQPELDVKNVDGKPVVAEHHRRFAYPLTKPDGTTRLVSAGDRDCLYRNNGDGTFTDVTQQAGIDTEAYFKGLSATWWDYDKDGDVDLYVANDFFGPDYLYQNNGNGTFTNVIEHSVPHTPWNSMGSDAADINNDGWMDYLATDMASTTHLKEKTIMGDMSSINWFLESPIPRQYVRNTLYLNTGTGRFMEIAALAGLAESDWTWSANFGDLDNDGWVDVFFTNGTPITLMDSDYDAELNRTTARMMQRYRNKKPTRKALLELAKFRWDARLRSAARPEKNFAFRNRRDLTFEEVGQGWGLDHEGVSYGATFADLDRDGDLDLVVSNINEPHGIYRNTGQSGNRVLVRLVGKQSNRSGIGAVLEARTQATTQTKRMTTSRAYMSSTEPLVHFGIGSADQIDELKIRWPSGNRQTLTNLKQGRFYTIAEQSGPVEDASLPDKPLFAQVDNFSEISHEEKPFNDFQVQPLLPWKLSQLGPGLAVGDIDGDGDDDIVSSGAAGQATQIHINNGSGRFSPSPSTAVTAHASKEDMAPLLFDADGDGDLDLYVASGGVECQPGSKALQDRLYLNNGQGAFEDVTSEALPKRYDSSSVVTAADFDGDGDLDLFVGGRVIPSQYPLPATSSLLRNEKGVFQEVTDELAPGLAQFGLVTGALWSDINGDARPDLLVTTEWGPIGVFINNEGKLVNETARAGLAEHLGWWNGIASADFDHDGDIDYVVTNFGLNSKYHASLEAPAMLYYGSFDASGKKQLIEAEREGDSLVPIRGRSCMSGAIPMLATKFPSYRSFGLASVEQICTERALQNAHRFKATRLDSVVLINESDSDGPRFSVRSLPTLAQAAPGFGVLATDLNGNGHADILIAQNFFSPQPETGRMDGGLSLLLDGDGKGGFQEVWPSRSGIVVPGDAKAAALCDLDGDHRPDLLVSRNDMDMIALRNESARENRFLAVRLKANNPNSAAIGSRVTLVLSDETKQTAEVHSGSGYLSQSTPVLFFGLGTNSKAKELHVRWPGGTTTTHQVNPSATQADISEP